MTNVVDGRLHFAKRQMSDPPAEPTQALVYLAVPWFNVRRKYVHIQRHRARGYDMRQYTSLVLAEAERLGGIKNMRVALVPQKGVK